MKIKTLTALTAIALMSVAPAYAYIIQVDASADTTAESTLERGWDNTKETVTDAAKDTTEAARNMATATEAGAETLTAAVIDEGSASAKMEQLAIDTRMTVKGMLDQSVYNTNGETIGNVDDIILGQNGEVKSVVVSHGGFLGLGEEKSAFDYGVIMRKQADGDVIVPVSPEQIEQAPVFVYEQADADPEKNAQVMAESDLRASVLLGSDVRNPEGETVAKVDNITLQNGEATHLIVGIDKALGTSDEKAALDFAKTMKTRSGDDIQLQMSEGQAAQFEKFVNMQVSSR